MPFDFSFPRGESVGLEQEHSAYWYLPPNFESCGFYRQKQGARRTQVTREIQYLQLKKTSSIHFELYFVIFSTKC